MSEEKASNDKSNLRSKLVLRSDGFELIVKGSLSDISEEQNSILAFHRDFQRKLTKAAPSITQNPLKISEPTRKKVSSQPTVEPLSDVPVITPSKSTIANIEMLFETPWGRFPRSIADVASALEANASGDSIPSIGRDLARLVHRSKLRRIQKEGHWTYFRIPG